MKRSIVPGLISQAYIIDSYNSPILETPAFGCMSDHTTVHLVETERVTGRVKKCRRTQVVGEHGTDGAPESRSSVN